MVRLPTLSSLPPIIIKVPAGEAALESGTLTCDLFSDPRLRPTLDKIVAIAFTQQVEADVEHGHSVAWIVFAQVGVGDRTAVNDVYGAGADHLELIVPNDDGCVFIDADSQHARVLRDNSDKPRHTAAFGKMLVDYDAGEKPKTGGH